MGSQTVLIKTLIFSFCNPQSLLLSYPYLIIFMYSTLCAPPSPNPVCKSGRSDSFFMQAVPGIVQGLPAGSLKFAK